jgi:hypothetical protein
LAGVHVVHIDVELLRDKDFDMMLSLK